MRPFPPPHGVLAATPAGAAVDSIPRRVLRSAV
jgi:hypothetical protein